jgi:hypothetical protein
MRNADFGLRIEKDEADWKQHVARASPIRIPHSAIA